MNILGYLTPYLFVFLLADAAAMVFASRWWALDWFVHYIPQFAFASLTVAVVLLMQRRYRMALILGIVAAYFFVPIAIQWYGYPTAAPVEPDGTERTVLRIYHVNVNQKLIDFSRLI